MMRWLAWWVLRVAKGRYCVQAVVPVFAAARGVARVCHLTRRTSPDLFAKVRGISRYPSLSSVFPTP